jgi:hypothetical protein
MPRGKKTDPAGAANLHAVKEALTTLGKAANRVNQEIKRVEQVEQK